MRVKPKPTDLPTLAKAARERTQKLIRSFAEFRKMKATSPARYGVLLLLAASFATAGTPDRAAWKAAWYRARQGAYQFPTNGLVSYWSMDSVSAPTVFDTWGSNDGTAVGTPLFDSAYGKYLDGVNLNGSSQYIELYRDNMQHDFTVTGWIKIADKTSNRIFIAIPEHPIMIRYTTTYNDIVASIRRNYTWKHLRSSSGIIADTWYFLSLTFNHTTDEYIFSVNSEDKDSGSFTGSFADYGTNMRLGIDWSLNQPLLGSIDEVAIFDRVLSSNEVSEIYNDGAGRFYTP